MITSTLPLYVMFRLQLSPAAFGVIDALQQGGASLMRLAGGVLTDRWRRPKEIAVVGYAASALCRLGLLLVGRSAAGVTSFTLLDRLGKGLRTSPRDAMISLSVPRPGLAAAFGVHRTLDTLGAMLGPIVAFFVLSRFRDGYDVVFVVSFVLALIGVAILVAFVRNPSTSAVPLAPPGQALGLRDARLRGIALSVGCLGAATLSDSFIYLLLQRRLDFSPAYLPILYVATPAAYMLLATPAGWIADRIGRGVVVIAGYLALLAVYALILLPAFGPATLVAAIVLMGAYYASTDGVVPALVSSVVPPTLRATGLSAAGSASDVGKIVSGLTFGWLWSRFGAEVAVGLFVAGLFATLVIAGPALCRLHANVHAE